MSDLQPEDISGLELSRRYYQEAVQPILAEQFPGLAHAAALIGYGSDVIGCDDFRSRDHQWGPRMVLFLPEEGFQARRAEVDQALRKGLPHSMCGYPTSFKEGEEAGVRHMRPVSEEEVDHLIELWTIPAYFEKEIGWDTHRPPETADWLSFSEHKLLTLTSGGVWHDDLGLSEMRAQLAYYPEPVWRYILAAQWMKIGQEEPFVGRTAEAGDQLGSRILAARMVEAVVVLAFLLEKTYAPYSKWLGTRFGHLRLAPALLPHLHGALAAGDYPACEEHLCAAYGVCAERLNELAIIPPVSSQVSYFFSRPFRVIHGGEIAEKIMQTIPDLGIARLPSLVGSVNQVSSSTDVISYAEVCRRMKALYR
jgi:hypothetical protein